LSQASQEAPAEALLPIPAPVIELRDVWLRIPVQSPGNRTLKRALVRSVTGGRLHRTTVGGTEVEALRGINCVIRQGERVALMGHNGAGKSTFLRLVSGIYQPSSGERQRHCTVFPMLQKSFITSPDLSGADAAKGHYPGPTESPSQVGWCGHAGAGFVGTAPVRWPTPLPLLI
jgi:lipopolysaccharide transport system ATP-binding protein